MTAGGGREERERGASVSLTLYVMPGPRRVGRLAPDGTAAVERPASGGCRPAYLRAKAWVREGGGRRVSTAVYHRVGVVCGGKFYPEPGPLQLALAARRGDPRAVDALLARWWRWRSAEA